MPHVGFESKLKAKFKYLSDQTNHHFYKSPRKTTTLNEADWGAKLEVENVALLHPPEGFC